MNWDFGVISTRGIATDVILQNVNILDTKHAGIHLMRMGGMVDKGWMRWEGGLLAGQSSNDVCTACETRSDPGCHPKLSSQSFNQDEPFTPAVGLQSSQFALGFAVGPEKKPYDKPMGYSLIHGMFNISSITLADFLGPAGCGGSQAGTYALANHPKAPEAFYPHYFSNISVRNIGIGVSQGMFYHTPPDPDWRNEADCGEAIYTRADGSQLLLNCAGPAHAYWRDLDGSLTGTVGTTAGIFTQKRVFPMDQGSPVLPGACTYSQVQKSYQCTVNSSSYVVEPGLDPRYKPNPVPADGIWGDPQMLVLESRDKDSEDRNFGPVFFNVSGSIDVVTTAMDHGWCFAYTCQKRLSTFWTYVPTGQTVYINFTGTPSQSFRIWFPYADPNKEVVVVINMLYTLNRRFTWLPPGNGNSTGRVMPSATPIKIGDGTPHGAYFWDQDNTLLYVKIKGGMTVETRTESTVMVSQSFAVSIENFYAQQTGFLKNLAFVMGIDMNRIYVAKVVAGSVTASIGLEPDKNITVDALPDNTVSVGVDPTDPVVTDPATNSLTALPPPPSSPSSSSSSPPPPSSSTAVLADLTAMVEKFIAAVSDPNATSSLGFTPIGTAKVDWSGVAEAAAPPPPSPQTSTPLQADAVASSPPVAVASSLPPGAPFTSNTEDALAGNGGNVGNTNNTGKGNGSLSKTAIIGMVVGVIGGCILVGLVVVVARSKRRNKRLRPVSPPGTLSIEVSSSIPPTPAGGRPSSGNAREAFVVTNSSYETPAERAAASSDSGNPTQMQESLAEVPMSPRSTLLAAGPTPTSPPEIIGPLGNPSSHSSLPLMAPPAQVGVMGSTNMETTSPCPGTGSFSISGNGAAIAGRSTSGSIGGSRSPAQLMASQSTSRRPSETTMKFAPNQAISAADWDGDSPEAEQLPAN
ncbi:hypothetical protein Vretimale_9535 [Volvox reticuliferus]|uniref:Uncharacterized protein n=1 Tax=Volvox reticuliferus TaxID=1737510 RepID=A0A8J4CXH9_9CHLO|nr:hypothetical protein Vretifemale_19276 [Volvox reticuliferus]GIM05122.1 hypothetical protein Vretimale_9535 [Volvox reticuliferus]